MWSTTEHRTPSAAALLAAVAVCGCAAPHAGVRNAWSAERASAYLADKPAELQPMYRRALGEGERNWVLNQMRCGLAAFELGDARLAMYSFDEALSRINAVYADDPAAQQARSLWYEEGSKTFRGEPYERAMAFYYRSLLYALDGDYENARAAARAALIQDSFAEEEQHRCDFALALFLQGWAAQRIGDAQLAAEAYDKVALLRPDFVRPTPDDNTLVVIETGGAPRKLTDGIGHSKLVYRRCRDSAEKRVQVRVSDRAVNAYPMEDVAWQAMTRGGRMVDYVLEGKVAFQRENMRAGSVLSDASVALMITSSAFEGSSDRVFGIGAGLGVLGGIQILTAMNAKPRADDRYWDTLPECVHVLTLSAAPGSEIQVDFLDERARPLPELTRHAAIRPAGNGSGLVWLRSRSALVLAR